MLTEQLCPHQVAISLKVSKAKQKRPFQLRKSLLYLWYQLGSNQRHKDFQSFALPTEL
jgi:hypothetical protein